MATETKTAPPVTVVDTETHREHVPMFNVVLLDDNTHTYEYVMEMLQKIFMHSSDQAYRHALQVDLTGRTVVITCGLPQAEFGRDQIHGYGADPRMPESTGPMQAILEPATGSADD